jgi:NFU1 iron-sulfur cluster scaffold homolog, mitochondrial
MFIQTEATPNPDSLKFIPGREVLGAAGSRDFPSREEAKAASPLAATLFDLDGVRRVYLGDEFITITKEADTDWAHLKPFVLGAIMEHFVADLPVLSSGGGSEDEDNIVYEGEAAEIVEQIKDLIETRVRPAVAQDGGDIAFHSWEHDTGIVKLHMRGACAGCPSSAMTLKQGIENMLRHYVPEVNAVEPVM